MNVRGIVFGVKSIIALLFRSPYRLAPRGHSIGVHIDHLYHDTRAFNFGTRDRVASSKGRISPSCGNRSSSWRQEHPLARFQDRVLAVTQHRYDVELAILRVVLNEYSTIRHVVTEAAHTYRWEDA